jgi:hypothetical protein
MTVKEVTAVIDDGRLREAPDTVTAWVIWSPPVTGRAMAVLRAVFRDRRLVRMDYELFGEEYRRLVKGGDGDIDPAQGELRVLWSQKRQLERHAELCHDALEAYHRLVLDSQELLTRDEQGAWARALELRRRAEKPPDLGRRR